MACFSLSEKPFDSNDIYQKIVFPNMVHVTANLAKHKGFKKYLDIEKMKW